MVRWRLNGMGRPNAALMITQSERSQLRSIVRSRSLPHSLVRRAQIVLLSAAGAANREVARRCGVSAPVVSLRRERYRNAASPGCTRNFVRADRAAIATNR